MDTFYLISRICLIVFSLILMLVIVLQPSKSYGTTTLLGGGDTETFFGKYKSKSYEGKLILLTKIFTIIVLALSLAIVILQRFFPMTAV